MPITISDAEPRRVTLLDSPYRKIPTISVPTVPMPVQTAYAVPIGMSRCASHNRAPLAAIKKYSRDDATNPALRGLSDLEPERPADL
jgi:hypothetical protein